VKSEISSRAWETWNVIISMLEIASEKLKKNPQTEPIIRTWEVKRKGHKPGIVYVVFELLTKLEICKQVELGIPWEVRFSKDSIEKLDFLKACLAVDNKLQRVRVQVISEVLEEFERNLFRSVPKQTDV